MPRLAASWEGHLPSSARGTNTPECLPHNTISNLRTCPSPLCETHLVPSDTSILVVWRFYFDSSLCRGQRLKSCGAVTFDENELLITDTCFLRCSKSACHKLGMYLCSKGACRRPPWYVAFSRIFDFVNRGTASCEPVYFLTVGKILAHWGLSLQEALLVHKVEDSGERDLTKRLATGALVTEHTSADKYVPIEEMEWTLSAKQKTGVPDKK